MDRGGHGLREGGSCRTWGKGMRGRGHAPLRQTPAVVDSDLQTLKISPPAHVLFALLIVHQHAHVCIEYQFSLHPHAHQQGVKAADLITLVARRRHIKK